MSTDTDNHSGCDGACATTVGMVSTTNTATSPTGADQVEYIIQNMDCPTEEALIRDKFKALEGIHALAFNLLQRRLVITHSLPGTGDIEAALAAIGMQAERIATTADRNLQPAAVPAYKWWLLGIGGMAAVAAEVLAWTSAVEHSPVIILLALSAIAFSGMGTYKKGWIALKNRNLNINALMTIAVTGAVLIGEWPEAAMVMVLFALAEMIEALSLDRARHAIRSLMAMTPERATVQQPDGSWQEIASQQVTIGMRVRIKPGERVPLDGAIVSGQSVINQAPITGESMPVAKSIGDPVFAGTINETGAFEYRTTATASNTTLARIIKAVESAQASRAPTQRFVDKFARVYTPGVFAIALLVAIAPPLLLGMPWLVWIYKALVLLVIACPCALVISTPVTVVSGLTAAARHGILIKGGTYLEEGHKLKLLALDKTGTLTQGKPRVTDIVNLHGDQTDNLRLAASLAQRSDHPVSVAVNNEWLNQVARVALAEVSDFGALPGRGIQGRINNQLFYLGNHSMIEALGLCNDATEAALRRLEATGKTAIVLCNSTMPLVVIGVADTLRETSRQALAELHQLGVRSMMLSGDNQQTADVIARSVGIDHARGNLLPEDKLQIIRDALQRYGHVGMVGDGINDAPALAQSSIGFAMGAAGSDSAIETADVALMDDDLRKIPQFIHLSRRTSVILKQNIALALGIKLIFFVLAVIGMATLWMAVFADMGASLLVVANGLRLLKFGRT